MNHRHLGPLGPSGLMLVLALAPALAGCGATGSGKGICASSGGSFPYVDECSDNWTEEACQQRDAQQVNGNDWTFHADKSCAQLGFTLDCGFISLRPGNSCP